MRVGASNASLGGHPVVGFHVLQGVEEVNCSRFVGCVTLHRFVESSQFRLREIDFGGRDVLFEVVQIQRARDGERDG